MSVAASSHAVRRGPSRRWLWAGALLAAAVLVAWSGLHLGQMLWAQGQGMAFGLGAQDFDVTVNGQPWDGESLGSLFGLAVGAIVLCGLVLLAVTLLLPMAVGAVVLGILLVVGLVLGAVALPVLLVLALLMSPLLLLGGLAWMLLA